jgi:cytochrome c-type biogenesis protein CcmH
MRAAALVLALAVAALTVAVLAASDGHRAEAQEPPSEAELEAQALQIERQLLCPQCTNKRLDVCELAICQDMKQVIRDRLAAGDEPDDIIFAFSARYGDRVLAELPREGFNLILFGWVGGSILAVGALGALFLWRLRRGASPRARGGAI